MKLHDFLRANADQHSTAVVVVIDREGQTYVWQSAAVVDWDTSEALKHLVHKAADHLDLMRHTEGRTQ